jgi:hypothetical protein
VAELGRRVHVLRRHLSLTQTANKWAVSVSLDKVGSIIKVEWGGLIVGLTAAKDSSRRCCCRRSSALVSGPSVRVPPDT